MEKDTWKLHYLECPDQIQLKLFGLKYHFLYVKFYMN